MAERRMFAKTIIASDAFLDMPLSALIPAPVDTTRRGFLFVIGREEYLLGVVAVVGHAPGRGGTVVGSRPLRARGLGVGLDGALGRPFGSGGLLMVGCRLTVVGCRGAS